MVWGPILGLSPAVEDTPYGGKLDAVTRLGIAQVWMFLEDPVVPPSTYRTADLFFDDDGWVDVKGEGPSHVGAKRGFVDDLPT